ncbi:hypothetical protein [Rhizobium oryzicola]|uniref:Uncharacterized protein n=1 Tax=Rhizobium oryzicola TaxID=1232668 RepID=A0ABT8SY13_9HYPH|nr:hypothetical protein [Rhizobium oryzicola]MDO1583359.1 hypothetical protein [Rhizobium oryzicola]
MGLGSVTERLHFFVGEYEPDDRTSKGGWKWEEGEDIAVLEIVMEEALAMVAPRTIRDAKDD